MKKILIIFGTRPEAIKMAPLIKELKSNTNIINTKICVSGQHREMLDQVLKLFEIIPDYDLNVMQKNQSLTDLTSKVLFGINSVLEEYDPNFVIVQGDTTTTFASSLAAYYRKIKVFHIEAGLRTKDIYLPWPEEINRRLTTRIASYHFAPTEQTRQNLLSEGVDDQRIIITGNTVIDALYFILKKIKSTSSLKAHLDKKFSFLNIEKKMILVTSHRRENFGQRLENLCQALKIIALERRDIEIIYPVHLNPKVLNPVSKILENVEGIHIIKPEDYLSFVYLMNRSNIILTDSGGIQEEAPSLGKPVLVVRKNTERHEAIEAGTTKLIGMEKNNIVQSVFELLNDMTVYEKMSQSHNPYGDGKAAEKIVSFIKEL